PELISEVKAFALFNEVEGLLLESGSSVKSKIWTLEIFTQYMNQLVSLFLHSRHERIDAFFAGFLADKYAEDRAKKQKFCFTFLLSL
ncbi:hypothetical protein M3M33_15040, partial [Loigolactobacillus coryniformis]|uniref:hypothetical protein n=1 Tax=Loigolactobacillus coryniformis TaxID=1610 RepID=UPI00201A9B02